MTYLPLQGHLKWERSYFLHLLKIGVYVIVQELITELSVEALDEAVLNGLTGFDEA